LTGGNGREERAVHIRSLVMAMMDTTATADSTRDDGIIASVTTAEVHAVEDTSMLQTAQL